jgi:hypothetical protein
VKLNDISTLITPDIAVGILQSLGVNAKLKGNFRLRESDKTPSSAIYTRNGKVRIHDFGAGFDGDLIDTLREFFNMDYQAAKEIISSYIGIDTSCKIDDYKKEFKVSHPVRETLSYRQIQEIWSKYTPLSKISQDKAIEVIEKLIPLDYVKTANIEDKKAFYRAVRYDAKQDEAVIATFTPAGDILTIRHRRYKVYDRVIKWKSVKHTEANKYCQIRITNNDDPVFIIEGTHDYITALLLGINFIALPSKHYNTFKDEELTLLKGNKYDFVVIPDLDFKSETDEKYKLFIKELEKNIKKLIPQLKPHIKKNIFFWNLKEKFYHFENIDEVKDLTDLCLKADLYDSVYVKTLQLLHAVIYNDEINEIYQEQKEFKNE